MKKNWLLSGEKLTKIFGEVHNPDLEAKSLRLSPICRQRRLSSSIISSTTLTDTIDIRQICRQTKYCGVRYPTHPYMAKPLGVVLGGIELANKSFNFRPFSNHKLYLIWVVLYFIGSNSLWKRLYEQDLDEDSTGPKRHAFDYVRFWRYRVPITVFHLQCSLQGFIAKKGKSTCQILQKFLDKVCLFLHLTIHDGHPEFRRYVSV